MSDVDAEDKARPYGERYNRNMLCRCGHAAFIHVDGGWGFCDYMEFVENPCGCKKFAHLTPEYLTAVAGKVL